MRRAASASVVAAVGLAALLGGCTVIGPPQATFKFANGRGLGIGDSGAISVYTDLDTVSGWMKDPGSGVDFTLYREADTGCVVGLERLNVIGERYLVAGDDAPRPVGSSTRPAASMRIADSAARPSSLSKRHRRERQPADHGCTPHRLRAERRRPHPP